VDFQIVSASRCTQTGGGAVLYRVLRLPPAANPYVVTVTSQPFGNAILLPHLLLLDANGQVKREYARDDLMFWSNALSARFRSHPDETYLVVESDAGVTGTWISRIAESTNAYTAATGTAYFTIHTGNETPHNSSIHTPANWASCWNRCQIRVELNGRSEGSNRNSR
jgi:hypothetical protein